MGTHESPTHTKETLQQIAWSFARVFLAAFFGCWVNAGAPIRDVPVDQVLDWVQLAVQASAGLIVVNYVGPWEKRYGLKKTESQ